MDCVGLTGTIYLTPWGKYIDLARVVAISEVRIESRQKEVIYYFDADIQLLEHSLRFSEFETAWAERDDSRVVNGNKYLIYDLNSNKVEIPGFQESWENIKSYRDFKEKYDALLAAWIEVTKAVNGFDPVKKEGRRVQVVTFGCQRHVFVFNEHSKTLPREPYKSHATVEEAVKHLNKRGIKNPKVIQVK